MSAAASPLERAEAFCRRFGLRLPIALAPMAGACPPALSAAVARAGGLGACGALLLTPDAIRQWALNVRAATNGPFQINLWIPGPPPARDAADEARLRAFLAGWGPEPEADAGDATPPEFEAQCGAVLDAGPAIVSSIMGVYPPDMVRRMKDRGVSWWATATTVAEARAAEDAGADVIIAQGAEAGGHRGAFEASRAEAASIGLFALVPAIVDAVDAPVVAAGADARTLAAALMLGASAAQIGTGFLRCPEAGIAPAWADALALAAPEDTRLTRAFSGRAGRGLATAYVEAAAAPDAPPPAPYPVQRGLTQAMRAAAAGDLDRMQAWAGQASRMAQARPAAELAQSLWDEAKALLR
jgi:nitronate monooxygenase